MQPRVFQVGILQLKPSKGKRAQNLEHLKTVMQELLSAGEKPDVLVLPEGALTGYFLQGGVRELAVTRDQLFEELEDLWREVWDAPLDVVIGFFERSDNDYYNSGMYAQLGGEHAGIKHVHRKVFLPTYGVFDEERYQSRGAGFEAFDTRFGKSAIVICEDAWHTITTTICALKGAEVIYIPSASPVRNLEGEEPSNVRYWHNLVSGIAAEHGVFVVLSSLPGFEGGKGLMGASALFHPRGHIVARAAILEEAVLISNIYLDEIQPARYENPLLSDLRAGLPGMIVSLEEALKWVR